MAFIPYPLSDLAVKDRQLYAQLLVDIRQDQALADANLLLSPEQFDALLAFYYAHRSQFEQLYQLQHPEGTKPALYNQVFHSHVDGREVDMVWLRAKVGDMMQLCSRKNHWFCLYSVLKYRHYVSDCTAKHFADQMVHPDWFPVLSKHQQFTGDTLTEYNGYFNDTPFPAWNQQDFDRYRSRYKKTRWSPHLWLTFQDRCILMNEVFR